MIQFPDNFLWGAATSAYQVEGNNRNADWWEWEKRVGLKETSGPACRHYEFFQQDFDLALQLNHNAHRLSIEWSRIEPQEGVFSEEQTQHYQKVLAALNERRLKPLITLHHFTNPIWFSASGGWENPESPARFRRFVEHIAQAFCGQAEYWLTINEPLVYAYHAYLLGVWPPQEKSLAKTRRVCDNLSKAHLKAYHAIHDTYQQKGIHPVQVGIVKNMQAFIPCRPTLRNFLASHLRNRYFNFVFLDQLIRQKSLDFIGLNYYTRSLVEVSGWKPDNFLMDTCRQNHSQLQKNSMGWDIYPQGLYDLLLQLKKYNLPIIITENGICTDDDALRWEFIRRHLEKIYLAMQQGVKVKGYLYWSLLDNFEWDKGFGPRFGLIEVDYLNFERKIRQSAKNFARVCATGKLNDGDH